MLNPTSLGAAILCLCAAACTDPAGGGGEDEAEPALKALADFPVGVAVPGDPWPHSLLDSPERQALVNRHFNSITAENIMKMGYLQPAPARFVFEHADALVDYAWQHDLLVHGHALVWHNQAPDWMNRYEGTREDFVALLDEHVDTVAGHFAGRLESWDVVNEAFEDGEPSGYRKTIWFENIGPEYVEMAFRAAREADPHADLYYNDYDISGADGRSKLERILELVDDFQARGVPIDGIGFQMHIDLEDPVIEDVRKAFADVVERGLKVRVSELDISVNTSREYAEFNPELAERQRQRYADIAGAYVATVPKELQGGITVWGITDGDSWIPGFRNRPDWPLLFDVEFQPKPALEGMAEGLMAAEK
jgi:endo-1,4-beta-xylanase